MRFELTMASSNSVVSSGTTDNTNSNSLKIDKAVKAVDGSRVPLMYAYTLSAATANKTGFALLS